MGQLTLKYLQKGSSRSEQSTAEKYSGTLRQRQPIAEKPKRKTVKMKQPKSSQEQRDELLQWALMLLEWVLTHPELSHQEGASEGANILRIGWEVNRKARAVCDRAERDSHKATALENHLRAALGFTRKRKATYQGEPDTAQETRKKRRKDRLLRREAGEEGVSGDSEGWSEPENTPASDEGPSDPKQRKP